LVALDKMEYVVQRLERVAADGGLKLRAPSAQDHERWASAGDKRVVKVWPGDVSCR